MPILDLTPEVPRFPMLGKLRKGGEKTSNGYGPDLDHFRFTSDDPRIVKAFTDAYGTQPPSLRVFLPYASYQESFATWCELWGKSGLVHRCDGKTMYLWQENGKYIRGRAPCAGGHSKNDPREDAIGRLTVIIPELVEAGYVGYVTMETHSKNDILGILGVLMRIAESSNNVSGIEFTLSRYWAEVSVPGWGERAGQRTKVKKSLVRLIPSPSWVRLQLTMSNQAAMNALGAGDYAPLLPAGNVVEGKEVTPPPAPKPATTAPEAPGTKTTEQAGKTTTTSKKSATTPPAVKDEAYKDLPAEIRAFALTTSITNVQLGSKTPPELKKMIAWMDGRSKTEHEDPKNERWPEVRKAAAGLVEYYEDIPGYKAKHAAPTPAAPESPEEAPEQSDEALEGEYRDLPAGMDDVPTNI